MKTLSIWPRRTSFVRALFVRVIASASLEIIANINFYLKENNATYGCRPGLYLSAEGL